MIPEALLEEAAHRFALLGDPTRLRILSVLHGAGELAVGELALRSGVTRENASQHLARLAAAGVVARRREGTSVHYRVSDGTLGQVCDLVCDSLRQQASRFAAPQQRR